MTGLHHHVLPADTQLQGDQYRIESILGQGGFGITYLATDTRLMQRVAIKEYLPFALATRQHSDYTIQPKSPHDAAMFEQYRKRFLEEAQTLARFRHPGIVRILNFFEANNTAYMVMDFEAGESLEAVMRARQGPMPQAEILSLVLPLLDGLGQVHAAGYLHRDIKPANIVIRPDGSPVLLDFGAARQALGDVSQTLTTILSPGYAPFEQYSTTSSSQGPWTDIYALGAVMYRMVTGRPPLDAPSRVLHRDTSRIIPAQEAGAGQYSPVLLQAIDQALAIDKDHRPQSADSFRRQLLVLQAEAAAIPTPPPAPPLDATMLPAAGMFDLPDVRSTIPPATPPLPDLPSIAPAAAPPPVSPVSISFEAAPVTPGSVSPNPPAANPATPPPMNLDKPAGPRQPPAPTPSPTPSPAPAPAPGPAPAPAPSPQPNPQPRVQPPPPPPPGARVVPKEAQGWFWGPFLMNWIWGLGNGTFVALLCLIPVINLPMMFVLGAKGGEWAWRNNRWRDVAHFQRVQRIWAIVGFLLWAGTIGFVGLIMLALVAASAGLEQSEPFRLGWQKATQNPQLAQLVGQPITQDGMVWGEINATSGSAELTTTVRGPQGHGELQIIGTRANEQWEITGLRFTPAASGSSSVDLLLDQASSDTPPSTNHDTPPPSWDEPTPTPESARSIYGGSH